MEKTKLIFGRYGITVVEAGSSSYLDYENIMAFEKLGAYLCIKGTGGEIYTINYLKDVESNISDHFQRISPTVIVNLIYVVKIKKENSGGTLYLRNDKHYHVSRRNLKKLLDTYFEIQNSDTNHCLKCLFCTERQKCEKSEFS